MEKFNQWRALKTKQIELWLESRTSDKLLVRTDKNGLSTDQKLLQAMRYTLLDGGKRLRAILVYAGGECVNSDINTLNHLAGAVEAVHAYSLIHDDLPCMDNDDLRRGRPTCHKVYGEALALLAGDGLHALAFEWVLQIINRNSVNIKPNVYIKTHELLKLLSASIGYEGMVGGQAIDIGNTDNTLTPESAINYLENMHRRKTGELIKASLLMGVLTSDLYVSFCDLPQMIINYSEKLGLLFQVVDDYLDATADSQTLGKTAGKDAKDGKLTYVTILGLEKTQEKINQLLEEIQNYCEQAKELYPAVATENLSKIALWVARRKN